MVVRLMQQRNAFLSIQVTPDGISKDTRPALAKVPSLISLIPSGSTMQVREVHSRKAAFPIEVTLAGICIKDTLLHPAKAHSPIVVTPSGRTMDVKFKQLPKAHSPIVVNPSGRIKLDRIVH